MTQEILKPGVDRSKYISIIGWNGKYFYSSYLRQEPSPLKPGRTLAVALILAQTPLFASLDCAIILRPDTRRREVLAPLSTNGYDYWPLVLYDTREAISRDNALIDNPNHPGNNPEITAQGAGELP